MPPRAPVVWTTTNVTRGERIKRRLDDRHRELSREARLRGARYRGSRAAAADPATMRLRADFLVSLGRLTSFEYASLALSRCRYELQVVAYADDLARDYFQLWHLLSRRGTVADSEEERSAERLDAFAVQLGRLEGLADALLIAGRNVRLFPPPHVSWAPVVTS